MGTSEVSKHLATSNCRKADVDISVIGSEQFKRKREIRESLAINRINPSLNLDDGGYQVPSIYTILPKFSLRTGRQTSESLPEQSHVASPVQNQLPEHSPGASPVRNQLPPNFTQNEQSRPRLEQNPVRSSSMDDAIHPKYIR